MKELIKELKEKYSIKHYGIGLKKYPLLLHQVEELKIKYPGLSNTAYIYILEYDIDPICPKGNLKGFKDYNSGFIFCGRAGTCQCAKEQVSNSVKESKSKFTKEDIEEQNKKREQTNLEIYGVTNVGQTAKAKEAHAAFYADQDKVDLVTIRTRRTCLKKYGVDNYLKLQSVKEQNMIKKYGIKNPWNIPENKIKRNVVVKNLTANGHFLKFGYDKLSKYLLNYEWELIEPFENYTGVGQQGISYKVKCACCGTEHDLKMNYGRMYKCKICYPVATIYHSKQEDEVFEYVQSLGVKCYQSDKSIINPYELDIVCPDHKIAIEYCGLYWHSEFSQGKGSEYHKVKMEKANNKGYRLITLFSDEWMNKKDVVKNFLRNILMKDTNKLGARKTTVVMVSTNDKNGFLNKYHIQGAAGSTLNYGLYYEYQLVALMCFKKEQIMKNSTMYKTTDGYYWNLTRFATGDYLVQGGASKLLKQFIKDNDPELIVSFADQRISEGNLYEQIGFEYYGCEPATYSYVDDKYENRVHKFNFRKSKLAKLGYDPEEWTEREAMMDLGYDRIWDCGKKRYIWRK